MSPEQPDPQTDHAVCSLFLLNYIERQVSRTKKRYRFSMTSIWGGGGRKGKKSRQPSASIARQVSAPSVRTLTANMREPLRSGGRVCVCALVCVCVLQRSRKGDLTEEDRAGCSSYLRISCREALISLPRSHSTGLGLSHLQCKAERMGRGRGGRGGGRAGESTALTPALARSLSLSLSFSPHTRADAHTQTDKHTNT